MKNNVFKVVISCLMAVFLVSCNPFESKTSVTVEEDKATVPEWFDLERARQINEAYNRQYASQQYKTSQQYVSQAYYAVSTQGILRLSPAINARIKRVQVVHTRNGYHPAFDVSGAQGVGIANGFQWINLGKNTSGIYNAGKPLSQYPQGKLGGAVWLVSGDTRPPFAADGNFVVSDR